MALTSDRGLACLVCHSGGQSGPRIGERTWRLETVRYQSEPACSSSVLDWPSCGTRRLTSQSQFYLCDGDIVSRNYHNTRMFSLVARLPGGLPSLGQGRQRPLLRK